MGGAYAAKIGLITLLFHLQDVFALTGIFYLCYTKGDQRVANLRERPHYRAPMIAPLIGNVEKVM